MPNFISFFQSDNNTRQMELSPSLAALHELAGQDEGVWELLAAVFDNLNQGIILADQHGRVVIFNRMAEKIMGYRAAEVIGRQSLWDFCEEHDRSPLFRESLRRGQSFPEEEVEMYAKDNRRGPVGVKVTPLYGQDGALKGALATIRSLEEIREREREHKSLVRLASIGRIISAIAHEINNPLQTVRTSLELGLDPRKTPARRQAYLETANEEISRISRVIGQMRDFYRPNPGQKQLTDVNETLHDALALLDDQIEKSGVEIKLELVSDLPEVSLIDYQLQQVFLNLILNALEAMPEGGHLFISSQLEDSKVLVAFHDSAAPLPPRHAANFFDPFAPNGRGGELTLGLSVSREIITELGGSIEIQSDDGNTLIVRLPY